MTSLSKFDFADIPPTYLAAILARMLGEMPEATRAKVLQVLWRGVSSALIELLQKNRDVQLATFLLFDTYIRKLGNWKEMEKFILDDQNSDRVSIFIRHMAGEMGAQFQKEFDAGRLG